MQYMVLRIDEDVDFGCEERSLDTPIMAVVTLKGESGEIMQLRQPDQMLYDLDINEGDIVFFDEKNMLYKKIV